MFMHIVAVTLTHWFLRILINYRYSHRSYKSTHRNITILFNILYITRSYTTKTLFPITFFFVISTSHFSAISIFCLLFLFIFVVLLFFVNIEPYRLFDVKSVTAVGSDSLSEQLRRERMRLFVSGVSSYAWMKK